MQESNRYKNRFADVYTQNRSDSSRYAKREYPTEPEISPAEATTFKGKLKQFGPAMRKINRFIERAFPNTADDIAIRVSRATPVTIIICYVLLVVGVIASRLNILWSEGSLWGIASLAVAMVGVFMWIWSSSILILPDLSEKARTSLRRAMRIQASAFVASLLTIVYFIGMALGAW